MGSDKIIELQKHRYAAEKKYAQVKTNVHDKHPCRDILENKCFEYFRKYFAGVFLWIFFIFRTLFTWTQEVN